MTLVEGNQYQLPDGTIATCTGIVYGIKSEGPDDVTPCEIAHTVKTEPCGYFLETDDRQITVKHDGNILQRKILSRKEDDDSSETRYGWWQQTGLRLDDIQEVGG